MNRHVTGTFTFASWEENTSAEAEGGAKLGRASVANTFTGAVEAAGAVEYALVYTSPTEGVFCGYEHLTGSVEGRAGAFVIEHRGRFSGDTVHCALTVVPGSGSGELAGITGGGSFIARQGEPTTTYALDYHLG
ncbi:DUF3224 domain-containing protein [Streptantibioticus ferralitis]|uniref:DUF3224 domain-containing protein n=1 Tax=Streptantibioticus ferralitis TaxID=236510 RepID=A0ABT5Z8K2_9ACTN|nr:DUF3224 domain-containing protein [Streptantibioticus ferralitis]MDF2260157.1 DUF3224 domain-containing protein [Streptantibioticus ferralitis]